MEWLEDGSAWILKPRRTFRVIIVGAGIAGLVTAIGLKRSGHDVLVLEQAPELGEIGAGIQIAPNASRILRRFGLLEKVMSRATIIDSNSSRRWKNDAEISSSPLMPQVERKYDAPLAVIHRPDLQRILLDALAAAHVDIRLNQKATKVDPNFSGRIQVNSGECIDGDLIIAADGIKSTIRGQMAARHGVVDRTIPTGDAAYRLVIPREKLRRDPELLKMVDTNNAIRWMGQGAHVVSYPVKNNQAYNMVLVHPQKPGSGTKESWSNKGDKKEMLEVYKDWNHVLLRLLTYIPEGEIMEWTLNSHVPLPTWVENCCALAGDACHPMLPYVAQGAAQAMEDAGVLTVLLSLAEEAPLALRVYEKLRKTRAEEIQNSADRTRTTLHLPDGRQQEERDRKMSGKGRNPDLWLDQKWQDFMWDVDVMKDALVGWERLAAVAQ